MKKFILFILTFVLFYGVNELDAQQRYLDPIFDDVQVTPATLEGAAGSNYTILNWIFASSQGAQGNTLRQPLVFDTYTPAGDTETARPLVLYMHTGNFFPFPLNGSCGGTRGDSTNVEIATRLAKMGYVVAAVDYRLGWLPTHPQELVRRFSLINGAYRGVQDVSTYIRYFKRTVEEAGNPYGIDPDKIVVWGQGTGGYLSLNSAYLQEYTEILTTSDPNKFQLPLGDGTSIPMVIEKYNGSIDGTNEGNDVLGQPIPTVTTVDATYNAISSLPVGDTLSVPNHVGYDSDFQLAVNMGGALGDSTWVSEGEVPLVSFHAVHDEFAPYNTDVLLVPTATGPQPVVEVSGSYDVQRAVDRLGLNDIFNELTPEQDPFGANRGEDFIGLCSFDNTPEDSSAPWEWTDLDNPDLIADDCNGDASIGRTYIDTIVGFYAPRACVALGLNCFTVNTKEVSLGSDYLTVAPNPTEGRLLISSEKSNILKIEVYSVEGRLMNSINNVNAATYQYNSNLPSGIYFIKSYFDEGVATKKVIFK